MNKTCSVMDSIMETINFKPLDMQLHLTFNFLLRDALVHSAVLRLHVIRLSVWPSVCL